MYSSGLGQTNNEVIGARDIFLRQITRLDEELLKFPDVPIARQARAELDKAKRWFRLALDRFYTDGNNPGAMKSIVMGMEYAHAASKLIQQLDPQSQVAAQAEAATREAASVTYQLKRTLEAITEPVAQTLEPLSVVAAEAVRSNWWLVPIVGGGLVVLFLRR